MPVLALNALTCLPLGCRVESLRESEALRLLVRLPTMAFALALGWLVYRWTLRGRTQITWTC